MPRQFLAFDLGAESGRAIIGAISGDRLETEVLHRFPTQGVQILGVRQWDITRIHSELLAGISAAVKARGPALDGIAIDTWGVDFALLASDNSLLGNPVAYRDARTEGVMEAAFQTVSRADIYQSTGIAFLPFNTIYQLMALKNQDSPLLPAADRMLFLGGLLGYWLSGIESTEYTIASTGQMLRAGTLEWDTDLLQKFNLPTNILGKVTPAGTLLGPVLPEVCTQTGLASSTPFISGAVHDTACAVAAVPVTTDDDDWAYLSSGTWSLLGAELPSPVISPETLQAGFTNEGGVDGKIRFLKNIIGLWVIQECRRCWLAESAGNEEGLDYATLTAQAAAAEPFRTVIDLDDRRLLAPANMPETIREICRERGEPLPENHGAMIRCALESLALCYRRTLRQMDHLLNRQTRRLHIIGGGTQNTLLNQMAADACGIEVHTGPVEATAIGNLLVQAMAAGALADLAQARRLVSNSTQVDIYKPQDTAAWDRAEQRLG